jgi:hypothetical protein
MSILPSSAADVARLIEELSSGDTFRRQTAGARLAVIGARAVTKLSALAADAAVPTSARVAALQTLEAIGDPRAMATALALAEGGGEVGNAAIAVLGTIARLTDARASRAFDRLTALVLDQSSPDDRRLAALAALDGVPERYLAPIYAALETDPSGRLKARAKRRAADATVPLDGLLGRGLPEDPAVVAAVVRDEADTAKLTTLRRAIEAVRVREQGAPESARLPWTTVRGQVHHALAARGSRLALYDLRETLEKNTGLLPVGFLSAAAAIGDAACLEPLAAAWVGASADRWWRDHLSEAFRAIVARERLTRRHPALKRILERYPAAGVLVAAARR